MSPSVWPVWWSSRQLRGTQDEDAFIAEEERLSVSQYDTLFALTGLRELFSVLWTFDSLCRCVLAASPLHLCVNYSFSIREATHLWVRKEETTCPVEA